VPRRCFRALQGVTGAHLDRDHARRRVRGKIKQNLFCAAIYNLIAILIAAGALYPSLGVLLRPEWAALAMSASTVTVTLNALMLNRVRFSDETRTIKSRLKTEYA